MRARQLLALIAVVALAAPAAAQDRDTRPGIAVLPFTNGGSYGVDSEDLEALQVGIQELLTTEFAANSSLRVVDRTRLREVLEEQNLGTSGRVDNETAARVGRIVGARYIVKGGFVDLYGDFRLDGHVVDVETTELIKAESVRDRRENLYDLLVDLAAKITEDVNLPPLPAEQREARKEREIPHEAITLFARAQVYQDGGRSDQAIALYERITEQFPEMVQAREALKQLRGG
ncbi:MAG: CsgG/HfaB family protein [Longimicrobiales bacterium]